MPACVDTCPTDYNHNMKQLMKIGKRLLQDIEGFGVSFALESSTGQCIEQVNLKQVMIQ